MAYTTKDALKVYLGIASAETSDDTLLTEMIARAQAAIDRECRQSFEALADSTRYYLTTSVDAGGAVDGRDLILDAPLAALTSVTNGDGELVDSGDTTLLPLNGTPKYAIRLKQSSGLWWTYGDDVESDLVAVTGRFAYSVSAPVDIVHATTRLAAWFYRQRENANDLDRTIIVGDTTLLPGRWPQDVRELIEPYVRIV